MLLSIIGFAILAYLGFANSSSQVPSKRDGALLVAVGGIFQLLGTLVFARQGRANPSLIRTSVRDLILFAQTSNNLKSKVDKAIEIETRPKSLSLLSEIGVNLGYIEQGFLKAVDNWTEFTDEAQKRITEIEDE